MALRLTNATIVDPSSASTVQGQFVRVMDGLIVEIAPMASLPASVHADEDVIDVNGSFLMAGMIDAHVHLASFADTPAHEQAGVTLTSATETTVRGAFTAQRMLASGVTTVRDLGCKHHGVFALKRWFNDHPTDGPQALVAGAGITVTGGTANSSCAEEVDTFDDLIRSVRARAKAGADWIKVFMSGAVLHPTSVAPSTYYQQAELEAVVAAAHDLGRRVAVHGSSRESVRVAVSAGVDSVEHGQDIDSDVLDEMARRGVFLVPTLWHYQRVAVDGKAIGYPPAVIEKAKVVAEGHRKTFLRAVEAGVPIAMGTDAGSPRYWQSALLEELRYTEALGVSASQICSWATVGGARCLGMDDSIGQLKVGHRADLVAWSNSPLESVAALGQPTMVVAGGQLAHHLAQAAVSAPHRVTTQ